MLVTWHSEPLLYEQLQVTLLTKPLLENLPKKPALPLHEVRVTVGQYVMFSPVAILFRASTAVKREGKVSVAPPIKQPDPCDSPVLELYR